MRRRQLIAGCVLATVGSLAGCITEPTAELSLDPVDDQELIGYATRAADRGETVRQLVSTVIESGTATATATDPPLDTDWPVEHQGAYYRMQADQQVVGERTDVGVSVHQAADDYDGTVIGFDALPAVDRAVLDAMVPPPAPDEGPNVARGSYDDEERDQSVLVPEPEYGAIEREGRVYPIELDEVEVRELYEFTYEADQVAEDDPTFLAWVRSTYRFVLSDLSAAERDVVEEAIDGTYLANDSDEAFESLAEWLYAHVGFGVDDQRGEWFLEYEGTEYWATLQYFGRDTG